MTSQNMQLNYDAKPADYFERLPPEMLAFAQVKCQRLLEVLQREVSIICDLYPTRDSSAKWTEHVWSMKEI